MPVHKRNWYRVSHSLSNPEFL